MDTKLCKKSEAFDPKKCMKKRDGLLGRNGKKG